MELPSGVIQVDSSPVRPPDPTRNDILIDASNHDQNSIVCQAVRRQIRSAAVFAANALDQDALTMSGDNMKFAVQMLEKEVSRFRNIVTMADAHTCELIAEFGEGERYTEECRRDLNDISVEASLFMSFYDNELAKSLHHSNQAHIEQASMDARSLANKVKQSLDHLVAQMQPFKPKKRAFGLQRRPRDAAERGKLRRL